jgi:peroxiredoxin (alkyl hydroperoxide reductase subunit C)
MISVGQKFPAFSKLATVSLENGKEFTTLTNADHTKAGKWAVIFWYPKDFTFVCPTELVEFDKHHQAIKERNGLLYGASTDSEFVHLAWRQHHPDLKNLSYPLIADTSKSLAEELGILEAKEKIAYRATFIVDPEGTIRWVSVNDLSVGRNVAEVVRTLDALQTGELCPASWTKGQKTLSAK